MSQDNFPHGFVLSDAAIYSFRIQNVYPDILSFATAIPEHLRALFLIPIQLQAASDPRTASIADRVSRRVAIPTGHTDEADYFGSRTFVTDDNEPMESRKDDGSIFDVDGAEGRTHHQDNNWDENIQAPSDTSYMSDVEPRDVRAWPYRTDERPLRHSFIVPVLAFIGRTALRTEDLEPRAPSDVRDKSEACNVRLVSYDKQSRIFTFSVNCGKSDRTVRGSISNVNQVALACDCPFWRYNGPEFHAKQNGFLLGGPAGTAQEPDVRDPDRKYWLCKHAFSVLKRIDGFVQNVSEENWGLDDDDLLQVVDSEWDRLEDEARVPISEIDSEDVDVEVEELDGELENPDEVDVGETEKPVDEEPEDLEEESDGETDDEESEDEAEESEPEDSDGEEPDEDSEDEGSEEADSEKMKKNSSESSFFSPTTMGSALIAKETLKRTVGRPSWLAGIGVGTNGGGYCVQVNVTSLAAVPDGSIPSDILGVPVKVKSVGAITAFT